MISIFSGFMLAPDISIKMPGLGLATAILVDAFLVRMTMVPAVLALLGRSAWWLPSRLGRVLPDFDVEGSRLSVPIPAGRETAPQPEPAR
jgi:RND superfamily putative drug exporter